MPGVYAAMVTRPGIQHVWHLLLLHTYANKPGGHALDAAGYTGSWRSKGLTVFDLVFPSAHVHLSSDALK